MLYYLFEYLDKAYDIPGAGVFRFLSFRAAMAIITSLVITLFLGKRIIALLLRMQVGETIRDLGLDGQAKKQGTPTMGGLIIIAAILIPTFLFTKLDNVYIITMIVSVIWLGLIGFVDDYIKVFKKDKEGLRAKSKLIGQVGLGVIIGSILYFNPNVVVRENSAISSNVVISQGGNIVDDINNSED
ncbi:MAG: phospho-N-acetylmuramoyl-pentapeptide-transferase, partial [Bacteroidia bacterium]|nr:phospho-N-acetylmuramoyl-pentapeptide-transferase [Bacteroidia bacterium]